MLGTKSPEKEPDVGGREEKKSVQLLPRGEKIRAWFPVCHPLQRGWCCSKFLLRLGVGGGNVNKTEGEKVLVDPSHSPKNLEISRDVVLLPRGSPQRAQFKKLSPANKP